MAGINWTKGFFRFWVLLSLIWAALMFVDERPDKAFRDYFTMYPAPGRIEALLGSPGDPLVLPNGRSLTRAEVAADLVAIRERQAERVATMRNYLQTVLVPSLVLLALGVAFRWGMNGFSKNRAE